MPSTRPRASRASIPSSTDARWTGLLVVALVLPSALSYAFLRRVLYTLVSVTLGVWNTVADFWYTLLSYPSDRALRRAYLIRTAARTAVTLRLWVYLATLYGLAPPWVPGKSLGWAPVAGAVVIALLPINALGALLHTLVAPIAWTASGIAAHLWAHGALYVFLTTALASAYGGYLLIGYVNADEAQRRARGVNQVMEELAGLRAELEGLKATG